MEPYGLGIQDLLAYRILFTIILIFSLFTLPIARRSILSTYRWRAEQILNHAHDPVNFIVAEFTLCSILQVQLTASRLTL